VSDRELHDTVITAMADARFRRSKEWIDLGLAEGERVERFSRFLARHFYFERVVHFFRYSRAIARVTGRRPEDVLRGEAFEAILPEVVLGSRETASEVARLVVHDQLGGDHASIPYFEDLLRYQGAMMVVEAGPRDWTGEIEPTGPVEEGGLAHVVEGTTVLELDYDLPAVLPALLGPWTVPPTALRQRTSLVVARTPQGRVSVVRANPALIRLVREADHPRTAKELAERVGLEAFELERVLHDLAGVGGVRFSIGS
jgi:hypothetical protein